MLHYNRCQLLFAGMMAFGPSSASAHMCAADMTPCLHCRGDKSDAKGFGAAPKPPKPAPSQDKRAPQADRKWQLQPYNVPEWLQWMAAQQESAKVNAGRLLLSMRLHTASVPALSHSVSSQHAGSLRDPTMLRPDA